MMNAPAICNCDFDLASIRLKCLLVLDIVTNNICVKFTVNQNQFTKQHWNKVGKKAGNTHISQDDRKYW